MIMKRVTNTRTSTTRTLATAVQLCQHSCTFQYTAVAKVLIVEVWHVSN